MPEIAPPEGRFVALLKPLRICTPAALSIHNLTGHLFTPCKSQRAFRYLVEIMDDLKYIDFPSRLAAIEGRSKLVGFDMGSEPLVGALIRTLAASKPRGRLLELGTGTGIATSWLLEGMDAHSTLVSVDNSADAQKVAADLLGHDPRLQLVTQDGTTFLREQAARSFDLVFADAMPGKYEVTDDALALVKPGGFYVIDDMLPQSNWPAGHGARVPLLLERLASDKEFSVIPMVWASGVVLAVRKG